MKKYFDFSKGIFNRGLTHLYSLVALLFVIINIILLLTGSHLGSKIVGILVIVYIPVVVTLILSIISFLKKNIRYFKLYSFFSIGYIIIAAILVEALRGFFSTESVKLFFENYSVVVLNTRNVLPGVVFNLALVVILSVMSIVFVFLALFLVIQNIQPVNTPKVEPVIEITDDITEFQEEIKSE